METSLGDALSLIAGLIILILVQSAFGFATSESTILAHCSAGLAWFGARVRGCAQWMPPVYSFARCVHHKWITPAMTDEKMSGYLADDEKSSEEDERALDRGSLNKQFAAGESSGDDSSGDDDERSEHDNNDHHPRLEELSARSDHNSDLPDLPSTQPKLADADHTEYLAIIDQILHQNKVLRQARTFLRKRLDLSRHPDALWQKHQTELAALEAKYSVKISTLESELAASNKAQQEILQSAQAGSKDLNAKLETLTRDHARLNTTLRDSARRMDWQNGTIGRIYSEQVHALLEVRRYLGMGSDDGTQLRIGEKQAGQVVMWEEIAALKDTWRAAFARLVADGQRQCGEMVNNHRQVVQQLCEKHGKDVRVRDEKLVAKEGEVREHKAKMERLEKGNGELQEKMRKLREQLEKCKAELASYEDLKLLSDRERVQLERQIEELRGQVVAAESTNPDLDDFVPVELEKAEA